VFTSKAIFEITQKKNIYTPIAREIALILEGKEPRVSVKDLLAD